MFWATDRELATAFAVILTLVGSYYLLAFPTFFLWEKVCGGDASLIPLAIPLPGAVYVSTWGGRLMWRFYPAIVRWWYEE